MQDRGLSEGLVDREHQSRLGPEGTEEEVKNQNTGQKSGRTEPYGQGQARRALRTP
jgi:hypothetical protein